MKNSSHSISRRSLLSLGGLAFVPAGALAQAPAAPAAGKEELVKIKDVKVEVQREPKFTGDGPKDKRVKYKDWLEIEAECEAVPSKGAHDKKQTTYPEVTFKYYVYLEGASKDKNRILTGEVVHTNVPIKEASHSAMYVPPNAIFGVSGRYEAQPALVKAWAVVATVGGETVGFKASAGSLAQPWWDGATMPPKEPGLKNKGETPFSILWGSYHLDIKGK